MISATGARVPYLLTVVALSWIATEGRFTQTARQYACESVSFPFCNTSSSFHERVKDLISRLDLDEKIEQLGNTAPGLPRLGIPSYEWWQEALHGVANSPGVTFDGPIKAATSFPQPILTAASFNDTLFNSVAKVVSTEARAMYNSGQTGLTFWSPNVNIFRDPRWGRGQETPGEDPLLSSNYAANFVLGMQEDGAGGATHEDPVLRLKTSSCCKHFTAYDLENWQGVDRDHFDALVTKQDLEDTFNPPFKSCVQEGRASGFMCSYNRVNGVPACASYDLLTHTARNLWKFQGYIVSDCDAVYDMINDPKYAQTLEDAVGKALQAGMDLNCGRTIRDHGLSALNEGKFSEEDVDRALSNLMLVRMRLGLFDGPPESQKYGELGPQHVCTEEHQDLSLEVALQSVVLLKNDGQLLPLSNENVKSLAVVGPNADDRENKMLGNYAGDPCVYITPVDGLRRFVSNISYEPGCLTVSCEEDDFSNALAAASEADAVVIVVGLSQEEEREGFDRTSLLLPGNQQELVSSIAGVSTGHVVLVIMSGGPMDISFAKNDSRISSILWIGYPGQAGGLALAQIIFGWRNPGGKLPVTWYPESFTRVPMTDMHMRPNRSSGHPGRTYRFYVEEVVYQFGHGLSYTTFSHSFKSAPAVVLVPTLHDNLRSLVKDWTAYKNTSFQLEIDVRNDGSLKGDDVLMLYVTPPAGGGGCEGLPLRQLIAYQRVNLEAGADYTWNLQMNVYRDLSVVNPDGERVVIKGEYLLWVGEAQHSIMVTEVESHDTSVISFRPETVISNEKVLSL
ncbi:hypothetical protein R1flu_010873 [Riccia fluitans]|uniref:Fibronectin type III-like domain-containing protein n=1 Tax=Riccia fluitans TaxID=41844 RepID=A0ABD1Z677_9MARC